MKKVKLGKDGPFTNRIGFGGWGIGGQTPGNSSYGKTNDKTSCEAIQTAIDRGVTFFDTSPAYGNGVSERLIGKVLKPYRKKVLISSKVGFLSWSEGANFSPDSFQTSVEGSLKRLQSDYIDVLWLHSPPKEILQNNLSVFTEMDKLKNQNLIKQWGVSCKSPDEALDLIKSNNIDLIQINFNMMDIRAINSGLMKVAEEKGISIIARTPLCFGYLTGKITKDTVFSNGDHRNNWSTNQKNAWVDGANEIMSLLNVKPGYEAVKASLKFCLSFPAVSVVLPGALFKKEVDEQSDAGDEGPLENNDIKKILSLHEKLSFFKP